MNYAQPQNHEANNWRFTLILLLLFLPFLIQAGRYLTLLVELVSVRNDAVYPEGANVFSALWSVRTGKLYTHPFEFPYDVQAYGPVFCLTGVISAKLAHQDPMLTTELWRTLSLLSFLASAGVIGFLCWRLEKRTLFVPFCVGLCLACPWSVPWSASARPDSLSTLFILGGMAFYLAAEGRRGFLVVAGILATLSCLTKQTTVPILLAPVIDSLMARRLRDAAAFVVGCLPVPLVMFVVLGVRHEPFLPNFLSMGHMPIDWSLLPSTISNAVRMDELALVCACLALLGLAVRWKESRYRAVLLIVAFTWFGNIGALANGGGNANYLTAPWLVLILFVPAGLTVLERWSRRTVLLPAGVVLAAGILFIHQRHLLWNPAALPEPMDTTGLDRLSMLADNPYLELRSRRPELLDPFFYHVVSRQHLWSPTPILREIEGEDYDLVLMRGADGQSPSEFYALGFHGVAFWGSDMLQELMGHYRVLCESTGALAMVPKSRPAPVRDEDIGRILGHPCQETRRIPRMNPQDY